MHDPAMDRELAALAHENAVLARELGQVQQRATRLAEQQRQRIERLQAEAGWLREQLLERDAALAAAARSGEGSRRRPPRRWQRALLAWLADAGR